MKLLRIVTIISLFSLSTIQARLVFTTIDSPGFYQLSDELDNSVTIEVSDVTFDLNGHTITAANGIIINGALNNITIMNGTIEATNDGIIANAGCSSITLDNMRVEGAIRGINFDNVTGGIIKNCEMTLNTTGIELDNSHKITIDNSIANCNTRAGFDLISSTTCLIENCKALSTGEGNTDIDTTTVFGFASTNGYGNIFERCIANSTQALSVTGSSSLIAGFALRGSEGCTKIIDSESANTQTNASGFTVPYGILLEGALDSTQSVTGALGFGMVLGVDWSSDGKYVAVSGSSIVAKEAGRDDLIPTLVQIYSFDRERGDFSSLTKALITSGLVNRIAWSPSGEYLALQFSGELQVYAFDKVARELNLFSSVSVTTGNQQDIAWSFDERFIAVAGDDGFVTYLFDRTSGELEKTAGGFNRVNAVSFTPDGRYVAIGTSTGSGTQLYVIEMNPTTGAFIFPFISELGSFADIRSVDWSPDGHYLVAGGANIITSEGNGVEVFQHDRDAETLTNIVGDLVTTGTIYSADWSPDGQYIAVGGSSIGSGTGDDFQILEFDRAAQTLQVRDGDLGVSSFISDTKWSPDGQYIAVGGVGITGGSGDLFQIMTGLQFPSKNVIKGNMVYCNSGNQFPNGVGISGSSIANMIIGNTAFNNPLATAKDKPIVGSNYQFGTNTFNQLFGQSPGDTQNISLDGCDPLCTPNDISMLIRQTLFKVCHIQSQQDVIESLIDNASCAPTPVGSAGTISSSGIYCLDNEISGAITIAASNIDIDLNNYRVTSGVIVNGGLDQITIRNGVVEGSTDAILVNGGTTNVTLEGVVVKNAIRGINFDNVTGGLIENCEMTLNTTGLELDNSHNITVKDCIANCNTHAGFDLISSTTNCFENCKALSTGEGNTDIDSTTVFGFASTNGYGNIFERCIANSTQALSVTGSSSLIAGFALRGSEGCTKIIDSESANTQTNASGFTVPYGILLEGTLDPTQSVAGALSGLINSVDWSPDGKYVAVGGSSLTGGTGDSVQILQFDGVARTVSGVAGILAGSARSVSWSPDGTYIAVGGAGLTGGTGDEFQVVHFDRVAGTVSSVAGVLGTAGTVSSVDWSSDGTYIAVGGSGLTGGTGDEFQVVQFDRVAGTVSSVAGVLGTAGAVNSVDWSSDGIYIAVGGTGLTGGTGDSVQILQFDRSAVSVSSVAGALAGSVNSVSWSSDGSYIAVMGNSVTGGTGDNFQVLQFDRGAASVSSLTGIGLTGSLNEIDWSSDGSYIAIGGFLITGGTGDDFQIVTGIQFPQKNVIKGNTVYCNSGAQFPSGVGISGSSIANMIIGNTSYSNPIPRGANAPIVGTNYYFATNVFNPLFGQEPSDIQNISLDGCRPICSPEDIALLVKQTLYKVCTPIPSQLDVIESLVEVLDGCGSTALTSADVLGGTITLSSSGNYCLSTDLTADITITATCVSLDLNDRCLTGVIDATAVDDVVIKNGFVTPAAPTSAPSAAITIPSTTNRATIEHVTIVCADTQADGIAGRAGIEVFGNYVHIFNTTIHSGAGESTGVTGTDAGIGILVGSDAYNTVIQHCIISTGDGGTGTTTGGNGGTGISIESAAERTEVSDTIILETGNGGDGATTTGSAGHGITIASTAVDSAIRNCTIRNTGSAGAGGGAGGAPGKAIDDNVTTTSNLSQIFANFAHNIANSTKFDLQAAGEAGILTPNPPTATVINPFANVYSS